jgi:hypothetical protein
MMAQQEEAEAEAEQARLAERPARPTPLSRVADGGTPPPRLQPPAMGTWLSQADVENREAMGMDHQRHPHVRGAAGGGGGWGGGGGGGGGPSQAELERSLRKALKAQRDTEVKLQLELQNKVQLGGAASRMMEERELLQAQVEDIRGRLLEAKLQNVKLKNELQIRTEHGASGCCRSCRARCGRAAQDRRRTQAARGAEEKETSRDCRQACCFATVMASVLGAMMVLFALSMGV